MKETSTDLKALLPGMLSRRDLLRFAGYGAIALSNLGVLASAVKAQGQGGGRAHLLSSPGAGTLQLPFLNDVSWSQPLYYETIQAGLRRLSQANRFPNHHTYADINNDGQDELIVRGPHGILVNVYDPTSGQWLPLNVLDLGGNPLFPDLGGWYQPFYYETIQMVNLAGGDYRDQSQLLARDSVSIQLWVHDLKPGSPTHGKWVQHTNGPAWGNNELWYQPQYYKTIQTGYLTTSTVLIGRGPAGIEAWTCNVDFDNPANTAWTQIPDAPVWSDGAGWNQEQYYETIQCSALGNIDQELLIGQGPEGLEIWFYWNGWIKQPSPWGTSGNYTQASSYRTIQCADIDGDGATELLVRDPSGIKVLKFNGTLGNAPTGSWFVLPDGPAWSDAAGWSQPQYYETIQCADIDGDGVQELIGRVPDNDPNGPGIQAWKFVPGLDYPNKSVGTWVKIPALGPAWTDANGWNKVERYSTIQTTTIHLPNFNENRPQNALLGRGPLGMQTWYYNTGTQIWQQTSASYPAFTDSQKIAYAQLDTALRGDYANGNIRSIYNDEEADFDDWMGAMYQPRPLHYNVSPNQRPQTILPLPEINPPSPEDWNAVIWQIYWEMSYVGKPNSSINDYYGNKVENLISTSFLAQNFTLTTVGDQLSIPPDSDVSIVLSILALLAEAAAAIAGFPEISAATAAAVSGLLGTAFSAAAEFLPNGGNGIQDTYLQFQNTLSTGFGHALNANANNLFAITGGTVRVNNEDIYIPGDWGLMSAIGPLIHNGVWAWTGAVDEMVPVLQRSYGATVSQALLPVVPWIIWTETQGDQPSDFPAQYLFYSENANGKMVSWISESKFSGRDFPAKSAIAMIFDPAVPNQWNPLGTPLADVYTGANGWPKLAGSLGAPQKASPDAPGVDLRMTPNLTRDAITGEIIVAITLLNRGWTAASNVEITQARLQNVVSRSGLPTHHTRLARTGNETLYLRFPNLQAGQTAVLQLSGRYLGGTFGGSFRIKVP